MDTKSLQKTLNLLNELRKLDPTIGLQGATIFMLVAQRPGITMRELEVLSRVSHSSVNRWVNTLAVPKGSRQGFIELVQDPYDARRMLAFLTQGGKALVKRIKAIIADEQ